VGLFIMTTNNVIHFVEAIITALNQKPFK